MWVDETRCFLYNWASLFLHGGRGRMLVEKKKPLEWGERECAMRSFLALMVFVGACAPEFVLVPVDGGRTVGADAAVVDGGTMVGSELPTIGSVCRFTQEFFYRTGCDRRCQNSDIVCAGGIWQCVSPARGTVCEGLTPPVDAGQPAVDIGQPIVDAGTPARDVPLAMPTDTGRPIVDTGTLILDTGVAPPADTGVAPTQDAGTFGPPGTRCAVGLGSCFREGSVMVNAFGNRACSAIPGLPMPETCNGRDDNCDGTVDNVSFGQCVCIIGTQQDCYTGPRSTLGVGVCRHGSQACLGTVWGVCVGELLPRAEIPGNRVDDDCDGFTDE